MVGVEYSGKSTLYVAWFIDLVVYSLCGSWCSWRPIGRRDSWTVRRKICLLTSSLCPMQLRILESLVKFCLIFLKFSRTLNALWELTALHELQNYEESIRCFQDILDINDARLETVSWSVLPFGLTQPKEWPRHLQQLSRFYLLPFPRKRLGDLRT